MSILHATPANVNSTPVLNSTVCLRAVHCDSQSFTYASERCHPCFARFITAFDHLKPIDAPEPIQTGPTALDTFEPTPDQQVAYLDLMATDEDRDSIMAEWFADDRAEDMAAAFGGPDAVLHAAELAEAGVRGRYDGYDN
jgi:hypothetical protein